ncbi:hypothetical protein Adt_31872 [Abeliophyllum distichum]|uniref:Uncharacterized protein n=1 Tax=Abeliophyllum distichum TaxID=126358 RepID=A0ABD1RFC1_9LAMI
MPLSLGLGHLAACSARGAQLRSRASPTGTRTPSSLLRPRSTASASQTGTSPLNKLLSTWTTASFKGLSHRNFATYQLASPKEHSFVQGPLPLGPGQLTDCSAQGAQLLSRNSSTGTRTASSLLRPWSTASLKGLSNWDLATYQRAPLREHSFAQGPLQLGLDHLPACSVHELATPREHCFAQAPLPMGLGHLAAFSAQGAQLRSRASPTRTRPPRSLLRSSSTTSFKSLSYWTRPPSSLLRPQSTASFKRLSYWDSAT